MKEAEVIRTKMASALLRAVAECAGKRSAGKVGAQVIKANARGVGIKYVPRAKQERIAA